MKEQKILKVNYNEERASLLVTPRQPLLSSRKTNWQHIGLQHHIQPAIQTPEFQPEQHLIVIHLNTELEVERNIAGSRQRGSNQPGDITIIPAQCNYQVTTMQPSEILLLTLEPSWLLQFTNESLESDRLEITPCFAKCDPLIYGIGLTLKAELEFNRSENSLYIETLSNLLSMHLLKQYSVQKYTIRDYQHGLPRYKLSQIIDYINTHLDEEIKVSTLANLVGISRYYFASLFKQSIGVSPYQFILSQRVERSKLLLRQKELSLATVALNCGFANQSHFTRRFHQLVGLTPKAYRDQL